MRADTHTSLDEILRPHALEATPHLLYASPLRHLSDTAYMLDTLPLLRLATALSHVAGRWGQPGTCHMRYATLAAIRCRDTYAEDIGRFESRCHAPHCHATPLTSVTPSHYALSTPLSHAELRHYRQYGHAATLLAALRHSVIYATDYAADAVTPQH